MWSVTGDSKVWGTERYLDIKTSTRGGGKNNASPITGPGETKKMTIPKSLVESVEECTIFFQRAAGVLLTIDLGQQLLLVFAVGLIPHARHVELRRGVVAVLRFVSCLEIDFIFSCGVV